MRPEFGVKNVKKVLRELCVESKQKQRVREQAQIQAATASANVLLTTPLLHDENSNASTYSMSSARSVVSTASSSNSGGDGELHLDESSETLDGAPDSA